MGKQRQHKIKERSRSSILKDQKRMAENYRVLKEFEDNETR